VDLYEYQAKELFGAHGVPVVPGYVCTTPAEAKAAAEMQRQRRAAARDVDAAAYHDRLKNRLLISS
jgi:succinyl-CoA synthetase beta subunit